MKKWLLSLLVIVSLINNISALEVDFSCPESVVFMKEFECLLQVKDFEGVYDVKVDISLDGKVIAEIWDDSWKSAYYYLYEFVNDGDEKKIRLRIVEDYNGDIDGILKLRKDSKREFFDFIINIESKEEVFEKDTEKEEEVYVKKENKEIDEITESKNYLEIEEIIKLSDSKDSVVITEDIKTTKIIIYESKNEKIKKYSVFGFALLCVMFSVLVIMRKL